VRGSTTATKRISSRALKDFQRAYSAAAKLDAGSATPLKSEKSSTPSSAGAALMTSGAKAAAAMAESEAMAETSSVGAPGPGRWRISWSTISRP
jgi:hypothetical protein